MKRALKWVGWAVALFVLLCSVLTFMLYLPPVQDFAVRQVAAYMSARTGYDVQLSRLRITFPLDLDLQDLRVIDAERDTLVAAGHAVVDLDLTRVFRLQVGVDAVTLTDVQADTKDLVAQARVRGRLDTFTLRADSVDLRQQRVLLNEARLRGGDLDIALRDTVVPEDTTSAPVSWRIDVGRAEVAGTRLRFAMPSDSMVIQGGVQSLEATGGHIDLGAQQYRVDVVRLQADSLSYSLPFDSIATPIDYNHIAMDSLVLEVKDVVFEADPMHVRLHVADARAHERNSRLTLDGLTGDADITSDHIDLTDVVLHTPTSGLRAEASMDLSAFDVDAGPDGGGQMRITLQTDISKTDFMTVAAQLLPDGVERAWPDVPLRMGATIEGRLNDLTLTEAELTMPGSFCAELQGDIAGLLADQGMTGQVAFNLQTYNMEWLKPVAGLTMSDLRLPPLYTTGQVRIRGDKYDGLMRVQERGGRLDVKGSIDNGSVLAYQVEAALHRLDVRHFLPKDSIGLVSGRIEARGRGTDFLSPSTLLDAKAQVDQLQYGHRELGGIEMTAHADRGYATVQADVDNSMLSASATVGARLARKLSDLTYIADVRQVDMFALGVTDHPLSVSACMHAEGTTNLSDRHDFEALVSDIYLQTSDSLYHPTDIDLRALLHPDSLHLDMRSGDLSVTADASHDVSHTLAQFGRFLDEAKRQLADRRFSQSELMAHIPMCSMNIRAGRHNTIADILSTRGYTFNDLRLKLNTDSIGGINGDGHIYGLNTGAILLDTTTLYVYHDSTGVQLDARVHNGRRNPQVAFDSKLHAYMLPTGAGATLTFFDARGRKGVDMGMRATIEEEGIQLHLDPLDPVVAFRRFKLNEDNYVLVGRNNKLEANLDMVADDGTALQFYSTPNDDAQQDLTVEMQRVNLGELMSVMPYMPRLTGMLQGDLHLIQTEKNLSVAADLMVDDLTYEGAALGQLGLQAVYIPDQDGSQFIDGTLMQMGVPIATLSGSYLPQQEGGGALDVDAALERFPLSLANGFLTEGLAQLSGVLVGNLHVGGTTDKPVADGLVSIVDMHLMSDQYSLNLRFPTDSIAVKQSVMKLDHIEAYSTGKNPLVLDGSCDFSDLDKIRLNLTAVANNFELINAKPSRTALAYGKANIDLNARVSGLLERMSVMGSVRVLGSSDLTYVLTDSPLTVEDQLADLVTFVDFTDSLSVPEQRERPQHITTMLNLTIEEASQFHCLLSDDRSSYIDVEGGGNLVMTYSPEKDLEMKGRYTVNSGKLKYTMMVIPLKEFTVTPGSYVEFRGPVLNPTLSISATERLKTTITENDHPRSVNFDVGMNISQTLENMGLEFTLDAPEDMGIQNELASMSMEQRGRVAVTMLATGMYLTDANSMSSGGFSTQNALNAFLQSQISSLAGKALQSVDLTMGVENSTTASGGTTTDYSFRFAKRFWGNRISVIVGGRVSTGEEAKNTGETLIDNVSVEYRLDKSATRYVNLFYDKNHESLLDGEVIEMGGGLVLRRRTDRLGELFLFRNKARTAGPLGR